MKSLVTRRQFLATASAAASVALLADPFFNPDSVWAATPVVRRDVGGMDASDPILMSYRKALKAMEALPQNNPVSWTYQAAIHGTMLSPPLTSWNTCEHGTDFFWSWHRMYLYWFERIIRKMCGDPCWALPYWNWAPGSELQLPLPFRDSSSELYTANRNASINNGSGSLNPGAIDISFAFSQLDFLMANSIIQGPHGSVHVEVGGWMSSVPTAAQDPIFYLHHANVDRQWNLWLAQGGDRSDPLSDAAWKSQQYTFFDENGNPVKMTACDILRCAQQLNYVYEGEPPEVNEYCLRFVPPWVFELRLLYKLPIPPVELKSEPVSFPIELREIRQRLAQVLESKAETVFLELDNVEAETQPGVAWEVFVGMPPGAEPTPKSPYFVGSLALFGSGIRDEAHGEAKPARFLFPLNRALESALSSGQERLNVTFVPVGILINGKPSRPEVKSPVHIGKARLVVQTRREGPKGGEEYQPNRPPGDEPKH